MAASDFGRVAQLCLCSAIHVDSKRAVFFALNAARCPHRVTFNGYARVPRASVVALWRPWVLTGRSANGGGKVIVSAYIMSFHLAHTRDNCYICPVPSVVRPEMSLYKLSDTDMICCGDAWSIIQCMSWGVSDYKVNLLLKPTTGKGLGEPVNGHVEDTHSYNYPNRPFSPLLDKLPSNLFKWRATAPAPSFTSSLSSSRTFGSSFVSKRSGCHLRK